MAEHLRYPEIQFPEGAVKVHLFTRQEKHVPDEPAPQGMESNYAADDDLVLRSNDLDRPPFQMLDTFERPEQWPGIGMPDDSGITSHPDVVLHVAPEPPYEAALRAFRSYAQIGQAYTPLIQRANLATAQMGREMARLAEQIRRAFGVPYFVVRDGKSRQPWRHDDAAQRRLATERRRIARRARRRASRAASRAARA